MNTHRTTQAYSDAFQVFLTHTDEKTVLLGALSKRLQALGTNSLLDIGAGNGAISIPLAKQVQRYVAVEQKEDYVKRLQEAGLEVIQAEYPYSISEKFDAVLLSHSLPSHSDGKAAWEPFVNAAWSHLNESGHLLLVTYDDEESEWNDLVMLSGLERANPPEKRLKELVEHLETFGTVEKEVITTHVSAEKLEEIMQALAFVSSDGSQQKMEAFLANKDISKMLQEQYWDGKQYAFPFHHYLLDVYR